MAAPFKVSLVFNYPQRSNGWSETFYVNANDSLDAQAKGKLIATPRANALAQGITLTYIRVTPNTPLSAPGPRRVRKGSLERVDFPGMSNGQASFGDADISQTCALVRLQDATRTIFRNFLMRGIPDSAWSGDSDKLGRAYYSRVIPKLQAGLIAAQAGILHRPLPLQPFVFTLIQEAEFERIVTRKTGRPLFLDRGRR